MKKEIPLFKVFMSKDAAKRAGEVINSGFIGEGPQVKKFESELSCSLLEAYDTL